LNISIITELCDNREGSRCSAEEKAGNKYELEPMPSFIEVHAACKTVK